MLVAIGTTVLALAAVPPPPPPPSTQLGPRLEEPDSAARVTRPTTMWTGEEPAKHGTPALALCGDKLVATTLTVKLDKEFPYDPSDPADRGRNVVGAAACKDAVFIVVGDVGLAPGVVKKTAGKHENIGRVDLPRGGSVRREGNTERYWLVHDDRVREQVFLSADLDEGGGGDVDVLFVGDLNGDGRDDVVVNASWHSNLTSTRLFLSDPAGTLREVAHHTTAGC